MSASLLQCVLQFFRFLLVLTNAVGKHSGERESVAFLTHAVHFPRNKYSTGCSKYLRIALSLHHIFPIRLCRLKDELTIVDAKT